MAKNQGGGQQQNQQAQEKKRSRLFDLVLQHAPSEFAAWQAENSVLDEDYRKMLSMEQKFLDGLMQSGQKSFPAAAQAFLASARQNNALDDTLLASLDEKVFSVAIKVIEQKEKEAEEAKKLNQEKKKSTETFSGRKAIHTFEQFLAQITDNNWEEEVVKRYYSFIKSLSTIEKSAWSKVLEKGDQREKFALILRFKETKQAKDVAKGQNWI